MFQLKKNNNKSVLISTIAQYPIIKVNSTFYLVIASVVPGMNYKKKKNNLVLINAFLGIVVICTCIFHTKVSSPLERHYFETQILSKSRKQNHNKGWYSRSIYDCIRKF